MKARVICDGRGNGGTGARAAVLILENGELFAKAEKLDATTNIVAEHLAIQLGMELAVEHGVTDLVIWNDSQSPVRHILRVYQVKMDHLKPIVEKTWDMHSSFEKFSIEWVPRAKTKLADALWSRSMERRCLVAWLASASAAPMSREVPLSCSAGPSSQSILRR